MYTLYIVYSGHICRLVPGTNKHRNERTCLAGLPDWAAWPLCPRSTQRHWPYQDRTLGFWMCDFKVQNWRVLQLKTLLTFSLLFVYRILWAAVHIMFSKTKIPTSLVVFLQTHSVPQDWQRALRFQPHQSSQEPIQPATAAWVESLDMPSSLTIFYCTPPGTFW